jgi:hypothetical protein
MPVGSCSLNPFNKVGASRDLRTSPSSRSSPGRHPIDRLPRFYPIGSKNACFRDRAWQGQDSLDSLYITQKHPKCKPPAMKNRVKTGAVSDSPRTNRLACLLRGPAIDLPICRTNEPRPSCRTNEPRA